MMIIIKYQESKVDTLDKLFKFCVKKHGYRPCLGTREPTRKYFLYLSFLWGKDMIIFSFDIRWKRRVTDQL